MRALLVATVLALLLAGCQRSAPPPVAGPATAASSPAQSKAEGDTLMAQRQYEQAAVKYQEALRQEPNDVSFRFALAVALSYLPTRREEAIDAFRTVVSRGTPGSAEVNAAREWLATATATAGAKAEGSDAEGAAVAEPAASDATSSKGRVFGKIRWQDINPRNRLIHINVSIAGDSAETIEAKFGRDFTIGRVFEFRDVPPGSYHLVAEVAGNKMWDMKIAVAAGKDTIIDLTDGNAVASRDFSPPKN